MSEPIPILDRISDTAFGILPVAVSSPARVVLYGDDDSPSTDGLVVLDRTGKKVLTITPPGNSPWGHLEFSPDGRHLIGSRAGDAGIDLWNVDVARGAISRITFDGGPDKAQAWSPDGRRVFYMNMRPDAANGVWVVAADGSGRPEKLADANGHHVAI